MLPPFGPPGTKHGSRKSICVVDLLGQFELGSNPQAARKSAWARGKSPERPSVEVCIAKRAVHCILDDRSRCPQVKIRNQERERFKMVGISRSVMCQRGQWSVVIGLAYLSFSNHSWYRPRGSPRLFTIQNQAHEGQEEGASLGSLGVCHYATLVRLRILTCFKRFVTISKRP